MKKALPRPVLPFLDYQRIYQVIYSVLEASASAHTHRACIFFASAGVLILRDHYNLKATLSAGSMALMVDESAAKVVVYGREENGKWVYDADGFHAWVECDGWLIDFMAPIMGDAMREGGHDVRIPRNMLQKRLIDGKPHIEEIAHVGDYFYHHDAAVAETILDTQGAAFGDLINACERWFRKPSKSMPPLSMHADGFKEPVPLVLRAPAIVGAW